MHTVHTVICVGIDYIYIYQQGTELVRLQYQ